MRNESQKKTNSGRTYQLTALAAAVAICGGTVLAQTAAPTPIKQGGNVIGPSDLPPSLATLLGVMGGRMTTPANAQSLVNGTTVDSSGSRTAQIMIQAPGMFSYREASGRSITFDGTTLQTKAGQPAAADQPILESLLSDFPDMVFLQAATGGGLRHIGSHFRTDDGHTKPYTGPFLDLFAFAPTQRKGFTWGQPLQQELFIAVDEKTRLISEVRRAVKTGKNPVQVTQTQFQNWTQQAGQWFPGKIVRLESGSQTLSFTVQSGSVGAASAATVFKP